MKPLGSIAALAAAAPDDAAAPADAIEREAETTIAQARPASAIDLRWSGADQRAVLIARDRARVPGAKEDWGRHLA